MREWEAAMDQGSFRLQTPNDEATFRVKGAVYNTKFQVIIHSVN